MDLELSTEWHGNLKPRGLSRPLTTVLRPGPGCPRWLRFHFRKVLGWHAKGWLPHFLLHNCAAAAGTVEAAFALPGAGVGLLVQERKRGRAGAVLLPAFVSISVLR